MLSHVNFINIVRLPLATVSMNGLRLSVNTPALCHVDLPHGHSEDERVNQFVELVCQ